jgi:DNA-binding XRE family transcriptional regulator
MQPHATHSPAIFSAVRQERCVFAAKLRAARAILGWSQARFAQEAGVTQRAIHKLEQGDTEPRRMTALSIADVWQRHQISFEDAADGTFRVSVPVATLQQRDGEKAKASSFRRRVRPHTRQQ